jgi:hypothetical protein
MGLCLTTVVRQKRHIFGEGYIVRPGVWIRLHDSHKHSSNLAPAAQDLLDRIRAMEIPGEYQLDTTRQIRHMTVQDWAIVCQAFHDWPFAPQVSQYRLTPSLCNHLIVSFRTS